MGHVGRNDKSEELLKKEMNPEPMNTMLVKQPKDEAKEKQWWLKMYPPTAG